MNIIITPSIPSSYQHHISANRNLDALTYLNMVVDKIHHSLTPSLKDTPFITITRLRAQPGQVIPQIQALTQNAPKDSNLAIAVGLNSTNPDGHYHPAHGWRILSNAQSKEPSKISTALATAALQTLGPRAITTTTLQQNLRYLNQTEILHATTIPAVLTLNLYQDNRQDAAYLLSSRGRQAIIDLHVQGILSYIRTLSPADYPSKHPTSSPHHP